MGKQAKASLVAIAFHPHKISILNRLPRRLRPSAPVTRVRSFLQDGKAALASVFRRAQAFFFRIFPDDVNGFSVRKSEAGSRPWRTACAKGAQHHKHTALIHKLTSLRQKILFPAHNLHAYTQGSRGQGIMRSTFQPEDLPCSLVCRSLRALPETPGFQFSGSASQSQV